MTPPLHNPDQRYRPHADVMFQQLGDRMVLVHLHTDAMFELTSTATRAWELMAEGHTVRQIEEQLQREFGADPDLVRTELKDLFEALVREQLVLVDERPGGGTDAA